VNPGKIEGATRNLGAPSGWDAGKLGQCGNLEIRDTSTAMESNWYPSEQEKAAIAAGAPVRLTVWGRVHPPVSVNVGEVPK
jgi:hypothetical protein